MIDKVYTFFQKVFDGAIATATVALKNEFNQCPTKIIEIVTTGFSGTIDIQGSVAPGTTKDNVAYGLMGQDGTVTPSNNQLSYTTDTSRYRYVVTELYPFMDIVMTRSAGSVSVDVFGYGGVSNFPFDGAVAALAAFLGTKPAGFEQPPVIKTIDLNQDAGDYLIYTGTAQVCELVSFRLKLPTGDAGGAVTSIAVVVTDATEQTIIATKLVAVLTSQAEFSFVGSCTINVGSLIKLRLGGGAHGSQYLVSCKAVVKADVAGGYIV